MSVLNENTLLGASGAGGDYEIEQSLRFDEGRETRLTRTPTSNGNAKTWTWSAWVKRSELSNSAQSTLFAAGVYNGSSTHLHFASDNTLHFYQYDSSYIFREESTAVFRDTSAWYHIVAVVDTTNGTAADRIRLYVNGVQITSFANVLNPNQNQNTFMNLTANKNYIGDFDRSGDGDEFGGYLGEINFIDGQALTPDSFGETGDYGEWKPIEYAGTYGTNGFYLPFEQDYTVEGFSTVVYEGTGVGQYVGGTGFKPDFIWGKSRGETRDHYLFDAVRGANNYLKSNTTGAAADHTQIQTSFDNDGFTVGTSTALNRDGYDHVAWCWDMGGTTASNTSGTINSSVRANQAYGQSIVSATYSGSGTKTFGHGLASAPELIIGKNRSASNWIVYNSVIGAGKYLLLDTTGAEAASTAAWGNATPTSTVFSSNVGFLADAGNAVIFYCFHSVTGYSKFGSYSGSGSSGKAITTGFRPAFVMVKNTTSAQGWVMVDNTRSPTNPANLILEANESSGESAYGTANRNIDFDANGFTIKYTAAGGTTALNASSNTYIYAAFADTREYAYWLDQSGNNNDWTSEGGLTESDVMVDSPTNNFCTWNPLDSFGTPLLSEGNLKFQLNTARCRGTIASQSDGKIYFEVYNPTLVSNSNVHHMGLASIGLDINNASNMENAAGGGATIWTYANANGRSIYARQNGSVIATVALPNQIAAGDIIAFASDSSTGKVWMSQNNSWLKANGSFDGSNALSSSNYLFQLATGHELTPLTMPVGNYVGILNCGQDSSFAGAKAPQGNQDSNDIGDFYYPVPSGFLALCTANLPSVDVIPSENFNTVLYTGTRQNKVISGVGFQPDFIWLKTRSTASNHALVDSVRGGGKALQPNTTSYENQYGAQDDKVTAFSSDGFSLGVDAAGYGFNDNNATYAAWNWKAGGSASSNSNGSITSQVSVNVDAGFSIVTYSGASNATSDSSNNGGAYWTIGHGLAKAPTLVLVKTRSSAAAWYLGADALGSTPWASGSHVKINTSEAKANEANNILWGNAAPTSTVFKVGGWNVVNRANSTYIAYCFHDVDGYSKIGTYVGNGSTDGVYVHCGFSPAFIITKSTAGTGWRVIDNKRTTFNPSKASLYPDSNDGEYTGSGHEADFTANGFKMRNSNSRLNTNNQTYLFIAFAESPFKNSNAR